MEEKLLRQEEEFHRYNAELELKTKSLMKEVETVMNMQDHLNTSSVIDYTCKLSPCRSEGGYHRYNEISAEKSSQYFKSSKDLGSQSARSGSWDSSQSLKDPSVYICDKKDDGCLCEKEKSIASDSMIRVLQTKVKVLQNEVITLRSDYRKKIDEFHKSKNLIKHLEEEKNRTLSQMNVFREQLSRRQISVSDTTAKLRQKETENASLKKEIENLKKELKSVSQVASSSDVRLNRALEEVDKLKNALKMSTLQEKELQVAAKQSADNMALVVRKLEKQKAELMHSFRQQVQLIENFKSQMIACKANVMSNYIEENFFKLLDSGPISHHSP